MGEAGKSKDRLNHLLRGSCSNRRMSVIPDISSDDALSTTSLGCGYLHRVLEIGHWKFSSVAYRIRVGFSDGHKPSQFQNEVASADIPIEKETLDNKSWILCAMR